MHSHRCSAKPHDSILTCLAHTALPYPTTFFVKSGTKHPGGQVFRSVWIAGALLKESLVIAVSKFHALLYPTGHSKGHN